MTSQLPDAGAGKCKTWGILAGVFEFELIYKSSKFTVDIPDKNL